MDKMEQPQNDEITILAEHIPTTEKFYTTPFLDKDSVNNIYVKFGNSGFDINFDPKAKDCTFDFMPEGNMEPVEGTGIKYSEMFCASLFELYNLLNDKEKLGEFKLDFSGTKTIGASTNEKMIKTMRNIFSRSQDKNILDIDGTLVDINLDNFQKLDSGDPLIRFLKMVNQRAKNLDVIYQKHPIYH